MGVLNVVTAALLAALLALSRCAADLSSSVTLQGASVYLPTTAASQITRSYQEVTVQGARYAVLQAQLVNPSQSVQCQIDGGERVGLASTTEPQTLTKPFTQRTFASIVCFSGNESLGSYAEVTVTADSSQCTEPEASGSDFKFITTISNNSIVDQSAFGKSLLWQYNPGREGDNICPCTLWEAGFSTSASDVWSDATRSVDIDCSFASGLVTMGYADVFNTNLDLPDGQWFWFSVKQSTNKANVQGVLAPIKMCLLRKGISVQPTVSPSVIVFYSSTAAVKVMWDESSFNTTRCGSTQEVSLVLQPGDKEQSIFNGISNGDLVELTDSSVSTYSMALAMGNVAGYDFTTIPVLKCTAQSEAAFTELFETTISDTQGTLTWSYNWGALGACFNESVTQNLRFKVTVPDTTQGVQVGESTTNDGQQFTSVVTFPLLTDFATMLAVTLTVELVDTTTNTLVNSITKQFLFCNPTPPTLSFTSIEPPADIACEVGETTTRTIELTLPEVTDPGRVCGKEPSTTQFISGTNTNNQTWPGTSTSFVATVSCPATEEEWSFRLQAINNEGLVAEASTRFMVCTNNKPDAPSNVAVTKNSAGLVVVAQDNAANTVVVLWEHSGVWGNCLATNTQDKVFEVTSNGTLAGTTSDKQSVLAIDFGGGGGGQTRVGVECVVVAKRGSVSSNSAVVSFEACKVTAPSAPVLHEFTSVVVGNTAVFAWETSTSAGDDCTSKDIDTSVLYTLEVVDEHGAVVVSETRVVSTSKEVDVSMLSGDCTWRVTAFNSNTPSLFAVSTGRVSVRVVPHHSSVVSTTSLASSSTMPGGNTERVEVVITVGGGVAADNVTKESIIADLVELVGEGVRDKIIDVFFDGSDGNVTSVGVVFEDKDMAQVVADAVDELPKNDDDKCTAGVLCQATDVFINQQPEPSVARHTTPAFTAAVAATSTAIVLVLLRD